MPARKNASGIRSGRFKVETAGATFNFIQGCLGKTYRIFNSGKKPFRLTSAGAPPVEGQCSFDLYVSLSAVGITAGAAAQLPAEGVYEVLEDGTDIRSGRFKFKDAAAMPPNLIIDLSNRPPTETTIYRILNSGERPFVVKWPANPTTGVSLAPEQSVDIFFAGSGTLTVTATANGDQIIGIYESLGEP